MAFKDDFKRLRKELGLSQTAYAKKLGISYATVSRLESGAFNPSFSVVQSFEKLSNSIVHSELMISNKPIATTFSNDIIADLESIIESARKQAFQNVNVLLIKRNWLLGKRIVEEELGTNRKENYGKEIIISVSKKLTEEYGKGFERSSIYSFVQFYKEYKEIFQTTSGQSFLSWSHYLVLLQVFDKEARIWYENEAFHEAWSVRTLQRNVSTQYYYRILKSQKKELVRKEMLAKSRDEVD